MEISILRLANAIWIQQNMLPACLYVHAFQVSCWKKLTMKWGFGQRELCGFVNSFSRREPRFTAAAAAPRFNGAAYWNPSANGTDDDNGKKRQGALNFGSSSSNIKREPAVIV